MKGVCVRVISSIYRRIHKFTQPTQNQIQQPAYRIPQLSFDKGKGKVIEMDRMRENDCDHMSNIHRLMLLLMLKQI
jgi:hypothetical protein